MDKEHLEQMVRKVLMEQLGGACSDTAGVKSVSVPKIRVSETDRMDTGRSCDKVYTHDLFSLAESPRLGVGIMEMEHTTFPWTLNYDEMDYVIEGRLSILINGNTVTAGPGELVYIPKGSEIHFSVPDKARFLYFVYPADWQAQQ